MKADIDSPKWYLAHIKANGFDRAVANLARQGFLTFSPMQNKTVRHARQLKMFFGRYFRAIYSYNLVPSEVTGAKSIRHLVFRAWSVLQNRCRAGAGRADCRLAGALRREKYSIADP